MTDSAPLPILLLRGIGEGSTVTVLEAEESVAAWPLPGVPIEDLETGQVLEKVFATLDLPGRVQDIVVATRAPAPGSVPFHQALPISIADRVVTRSFLCADEVSLVACGQSPDPDARTLVVSVSSPSWARLVDLGAPEPIKVIEPDGLISASEGTLADLLAPLFGWKTSDRPPWKPDVAAAGNAFARIVTSAAGALGAGRVVLTGELVRRHGSGLGAVFPPRALDHATYVTAQPEHLVRGAVRFEASARTRLQSSGVSTLGTQGFTTIMMSTVQPVAYDVISIPESPFAPPTHALDAALRDQPSIIFVDSGIGADRIAEIERFCAAHSHVYYQVLPGGEVGKSIETAIRMCSQALEHRLPRRACFVGVGGGALLDTVGFAASMYRRGVRYVRIPTTLVGQIDVAVGIKQAVNLDNHKNIIGSFYAPSANINCSSYLETLSVGELRAGMAEMLKIAIVRSAELYELLATSGPALVEARFRGSQEADRALELASKAMMEELQPNLFEHHLERLPDFGHTFGPGLEIPLAIRHGEAVAIDMAISTDIARRMGRVDEKVCERILSDMERLELPIWHAGIQVDTLVDTLASTVAHRGGKLNLVIPVGIGKADFIKEREEITHHVLSAVSRYLSTRFARHGRGRP